MSLHIVLFAAGASSRMRGIDKLLEPVDGRPLLRRQAERALATGLPVTVLLPPERPARAAALNGLALDRVTVADAEQGMAHSLRAGLGSLPPAAAGALIVMADMPDLTADDLRAIAAAFDAAGGDRVLRATTGGGQMGSPAAVPRRLFPALMALKGDAGGRAVLAQEDPLPVPLPGHHALTDLDTPEDWAAWRAARVSEADR